MSCILIHTVSGSDSHFITITCSPSTIHRNNTEGENGLPEFIGHNKLLYALESTWDSVFPLVPALLPKPVKSMLEMGDRDQAGIISRKKRRGSGGSVILLNWQNLSYTAKKQILCFLQWDWELWTVLLPSLFALHSLAAESSVFNAKSATKSWKGLSIWGSNPLILINFCIPLCLLYTWRF